MGQGNADAGFAAALLRVGSDLAVTDLTIGNLRAPGGPARRVSISRVGASPLMLQRAVGRAIYRGFDLVHRMDPRLPPPPGPDVLTLWDLAPMHFDDEGEMPPHALDAARRAAAIITCSHFSAAELAAWCGRDDILVFPIGVDPAFLTAVDPTAAERARADLPERWVLHAGGVTRRKNLRRLAEAWPLVHAQEPDVELLLCGPEDPRRTDLFAGMAGVRLMGRIERGFLISLMAGASAVVVPSIYEGYGLPVQEAMTVGVPVVAVNAASIPEIAGPGAILVEDDTEALVEGILRALAGVAPAKLSAARDVARERTWDVAAEACHALYKRILSAE